MSFRQTLRISWQCFWFVAGSGWALFCAPDESFPYR